MGYIGKTEAEYKKEWLNKNRWRTSLWGAKKRCNWKNDPSFHRYGGRGIRFLMNPKQVRELWYRDKAEEMDRPSLDRIDNDGHYEFSNCRFIENVINGGRYNREKTHCPRGHEYNKQNTRFKKNGWRDCKICQKILS